MKFLAEKLKQLIPRGRGKEIADVAGISAPALSQYSTGERTPGAEELARVARALGVPMEYFFEGSRPAVSTEALRESPAEYLVDDVIAGAQEIRERAAQLEMMARKLKTKGRFTPEQRARADKIQKTIAKTESEIANAMAQRGIAAGDNKEVKSSSRKSPSEEMADAVEDAIRKKPGTK